MAAPRGTRVVPSVRGSDRRVPWRAEDDSVAAEGSASRTAQSALDLYPCLRRLRSGTPAKPAVQTASTSVSRRIELEPTMEATESQPCETPCGSILQKSRGQPEGWGFCYRGRPPENQGCTVRLPESCRYALWAAFRRPLKPETLKLALSLPPPVPPPPPSAPTSPPTPPAE